MPKDTFYFSHDYNARNDPKILELRSQFGMAGYGVYWCLIETMAEDENGVVMATLLGGLSVSYGVAKKELLEMIEFMLKIELLHQNNDIIFSKRMVEHKLMRKTLSDKGREGALTRWENEKKRKKNNPPISPPISPPNAKERKGKEINTNSNININNSNSLDSNTTVEEIESKIESKKKSKKEKCEIEKFEYADKVLLTEAQFQKLKDDYGADAATAMIEIISNYKNQSGMQYKSDYHAILNWVVDRYYAKSKITARLQKPSILKQNLETFMSVKQGFEDPELYDEHGMFKNQER